MSTEKYVLWGDESVHYQISQQLSEYVSKKFKVQYDKIIWNGFYPVPDLPENKELKEILQRCVPEPLVSFDSIARFYHSFGKSAYEYTQLMNKEKIKIVDAVIYPKEEMIPCIYNNLNRDIELIIFGGGTSVTGGLIPKKTGRKFTVSIDTKNLNYFHLSKNSMMVEIGAGLKGPEIDEKLKTENLTIGNYPESFVYSTLGGWIATNAAGQESNRYGKLKDMVLGIKIIAPSGTYTDNVVPAESAFLKLSDLATGSEGVFGVITRAWLKVNPVPEKLYFHSYMFRSFSEGIQELSKISGTGKLPLVSRLSDETETMLSIYALEDSAIVKIFKKYLQFRKVLDKGAILILVDDGKRSYTLSNSVSLGSTPSKIWYKTRYDRPYMWNELLKRGIIADTLETSMLWESVQEVYKNVNKAFEETVKAESVESLIMCHASHEYRSGTALYFTFLFKSQENSAEILRKIRKNMMTAILNSGGSISHHHGIGTLFSEELKQYKGRTYELLLDLKKRMDPENVVNPGLLQ